ncbi:hypothetical protein [Roseimaritima multifibrata]|uniref:hypothetical protein n=1 Tax=Roseimaritima multifibrata TaxID=1930274 RepID=UPI0011A2BFBE|nr:hypothetical protein [Roseimaritima multifibrata]
MAYANGKYLSPSGLLSRIENQPGGRHILAGGVSRRDEFLNQKSPAGDRIISQSNLSPSGLSLPAVYYPLAYANGKYLSPSGLKSRTANQPGGRHILAGGVSRRDEFLKQKAQRATESFPEISLVELDFMLF